MSTTVRNYCYKSESAMLDKGLDTSYGHHKSKVEIYTSGVWQMLTFDVSKVCDTLLYPCSLAIWKHMKAIKITKRLCL